MFDYQRLKLKIKSVYKTQSRMAEAIGISRSTLNLKLSGKAEWGQYEMFKVLRLLGESIDRITMYFYNCN